MTIFSDFKHLYDSRKKTVYSLQEYLDLCREDKMAYASAAERMLKAIGEPKQHDTRKSDRDARIHGTRMMNRYPTFEKFYGMDDTIDQIVNYFKSSAQGLEERKQILYLLGPVGSAKSSLAERLKELMESSPIYVLAYNGELSPVFESPLGLFDPVQWGDRFREEFGIDKRYLNGRLSPWAVKRLNEDLKGDITGFEVHKIYPSRLQQIAIAKTEPGDENNQDISTLVGKVDIRKLADFSQDDPDAYRYSGGLCRANQGLLEFVEMFKAPIKVLHPLLTATQEGNYNGTEAISGIPFTGVVLAHSNESEWQLFRNNKNNEAFLDRVYIVKVPYTLEVSQEAKIYEKMISESDLFNAPLAPETLRIMARFAVMSRLHIPGYANTASDIAIKSRVYDGENMKDTTASFKNITDYRKEAGVDEGMSGISTRWAFKTLSKVYNLDPEHIGANPVYLFVVLNDRIKKEQFPKEIEERLLAYVKELSDKYIVFLDNEIREAYLDSYGTFGQNLFENYFEWARHWSKSTDYRDPITGSVWDREALNKKLEQIEKPSGMSNPKDFRTEVVQWVLEYRAENKGATPQWGEFVKMKEVIEKTMFMDIKDMLPVISFSETKSSEENQKKHHEFLNRFAAKGYDAHTTKISVGWWQENRNQA